MKVTTIRLEDKLHKELRRESFETNKSMNDIIVKAIIERKKPETVGGS